MIKKGSEDKDTKQNIVDFNQDIIDVDLTPIKKRKFRLDGDNNRVIELNVSDLNVAVRLEDAYKKLLQMTDEASRELETISDKEGDEKEAALELLKKLDKDMRNLIDFVFDSEVADKAAPDGSLYDPINGKFRFEYIIDRLGNLYETNFGREFALMQKRMDKHTTKYTGKKH